jgi:16S rRNA (adenine1518-N6/adenine1519-N6)-dimethyltransferase
MTADALRKLLEPYGIRPLRGRSQHFLLDERVVAEMVAASGVAPGERVLEIGPGPGILTDALLATGADIVAAELDQKLCALLRDRFGTRLALREGDVLDMTNEKLALSFATGGAYRVVANLPYAITSAVFQKFLLESPAPVTMTVMIQKEVADRVLAKAGEMSSLAVLVQTFVRVRRVRDVHAGAFFPPPKVASSVIHMERKTETELAAFFSGCPQDRYFAIVRRAFAEPRKQLQNTLRGMTPDPVSLKKAFIEAKVSPAARPETLGIEQWRTLAYALTP